MKASGLLLLGIALVPGLVAAPITGTLNLNGSVGVTNTILDFSNPFSVGTGNTGYFAGLDGTSGTIVDLNINDQPVGTPFFLPSFLTLAAAPEVRFDLEFIDPGVFSEDQCTDSPATGQNCSRPGSPFNLTNTGATSSVVSLQVRGTAVNTSTNEQSAFTGVFSTQFADRSFQSLLQQLDSQGRVDSTYSASFVANFEEIPEPSTIALMGVGLALVLGSRFRRKA